MAPQQRRQRQDPGAQGSQEDSIKTTRTDISEESELPGGGTVRVERETIEQRVHDAPGGPTAEELARVAAAELKAARAAGTFAGTLGARTLTPSGAASGGLLGTVTARLGRTSLPATCDAPLWWAIEYSTNWLSYNNYAQFIDFVLCGAQPPKEVPEGDETIGLQALQQLYRRGRDGEGDGYFPLKGRRHLPFTDTDAYRLLKVATEAFVGVACGVLSFSPRSEWWKSREVATAFRANDIDFDLAETCWINNYLQQINGVQGMVLPYLAIIRRKLSDAPIIQQIFSDKPSEDEKLCYGIVQDKLASPCFMELIWSYWQEQGMLVQTMNAMSRRFQNIRGPADRDPLAMVELDPLRPLSNLLWGYIQDEQHRLTVLRRAYEYDHEYGLTLEGRAVPPLRTADPRSKFLDSFHNLLYLCSTFYKQDDDTTVVSDAFPILIALRDVHLQLTEGAHNQFGDLPSTARIEMLMQQWLLARPELRDVLPTRTMVDYSEPWMDRVDAMKRVQGWPGTNVMHFNDLARYGEQIMLSIRFADWNDAERDQAKVWVRFFRSAIQTYIHAYRIVTGVDLTADVSQPQQRSVIAMQPSTLLLQQAQRGQAAPAALPAAQPAKPALPAPAGAATPPRFRERRAQRAS